MSERDAIARAEKAELEVEWHREQLIERGRQRDEWKARAYRAEAHVVQLEAALSVRGGEWCAQNRAEGRGSCGVCGWCCKQATDRADRAEAMLAKLRTALPLKEWHEDHGPVLWWKLPVEEPPWVGTPLDSDWPGYHTHWTRFVEPSDKAGNELR